jgi:hypothetical protein
MRRAMGRLMITMKPLPLTRKEVNSRHSSSPSTVHTMLLAMVSAMLVMKICMKAVTTQRTMMIFVPSSKASQRSLNVLLYINNVYLKNEIIFDVMAISNSMQGTSMLRGFDYDNMLLKH